MRTETDLLGSMDLPEDALHGIHTARALGNFPLSGRPVHPSLLHAYGWVKLACAEVNHTLEPWPTPVMEAIRQACQEMTTGLLDSHLRLDALQGGAGTSTNMAVNEVLTNRALQILGKRPGSYGILHPIEDLNRHQSTNDTYPTALRLAAIRGIRTLDQSVVQLQEAFQEKEHAWESVVKVGRTELQDAVLTTLGRSMSAYAEALSRDRWRIYKCEERLRVVNLGGTAIGTGLGAPREYIFSVAEQLNGLTGIGFARSENLIDATQNTDVFVEVSGILKALAATLFKISNDLRLLSSGPDAGFGELILPPLQPGSSIMPGKVNPVIPEAVAQASMSVFGLDSTLTFACASGNLELNAFLPLIADALLASIQLLNSSATLLREKCILGMEIRREQCRHHVHASTATVTALVPILGYKKVSSLLAEAATLGIHFRDHVIASGLLTEAAFDAAISSAAVTRLGHPSKTNR